MTVEQVTFDEPELWRVNLGIAFSDLIPGRLDHEVLPQGTMRGGSLGSVGVFTVSGNPQTVRRTTAAVRYSPADMVKVCVQMRGRATIQQDDREIVLDPGQLAVYDTERPYGLRLESFWTCAVMAVRREKLEVAAGTLSSAMRRAHAAIRGPGLLLSQFITSIVGEMDIGSAATADKLGAAGA